MKHFAPSGLLCHALWTSWFRAENNTVPDPKRASLIRKLCLQARLWATHLVGAERRRLLSWGGLLEQRLGWGWTGLWCWPWSWSLWHCIVLAASLFLFLLHVIFFTSSSMFFIPHLFPSPAVLHHYCAFLYYFSFILSTLSSIPCPHCQSFFLAQHASQCAHKKLSMPGITVTFSTPNTVLAYLYLCL